MKTLKGTEKQVAWAQDIITEALNTVNRNAESFTQRNEAHKGMFDCEVTVWTALQKQVTSVVESMEDASKIIALKDKFSSSAISRLAQENIFMMRKAK